MDENFALILLSRCKGLGPILTKSAINRFGSAKAVLEQKPIELKHQCGWSPLQIAELKQSEKSDHAVACRDLEYLKKNNIEIISFKSNAYPLRLKQIVDAPTFLYVKGNIDLNPSRTLAIVGTRKPRAQSLVLTQQLIEDAQNHGVQIISGLAYGIDICAHKNAIKCDVPNIGVLAHGLDQIYPKAHYKTSSEIQKNGALISEMPLFTNLHPDLFPRRNRIIAGMSDAVVVVESKTVGGSMSTAQIARSYDRDVFAFPEIPIKGNNSGCNALIKRQVAELIEDFSDVCKSMNWSIKQRNTPQYNLFPNLTTDEQQLLQTLTGKRMHIDELIQYSKLPLHTITLCVLELELKGIIQVLPGKYYQRIA